MRFLVNLLDRGRRQGPSRSAPAWPTCASNLIAHAEGAQAAARARARDRRDAAVGAGPRHARQADHAQPPRQLPRRAAARARRALCGSTSGTAPVADISRTHVTVAAAGRRRPPVGTLAVGRRAPRRHRDPDLGQGHARRRRASITIELDLMIDEFAAALEGYLTRVQLLDILC